MPPGGYMDIWIEIIYFHILKKYIFQNTDTSFFKRQKNTFFKYFFLKQKIIF